MPKKVDIPIGSVFGTWTVIGEDAKRGAGGQIRWLCRCQCGKETIRTSANVRRSDKPHCGEGIRGGRTFLSERRSWGAAKRRCFAKDSQDYHNYGARGITMCKEWRYSFAKFLAHIGPKPKGYVIDRIDNDGNYEPGNVRWITRADSNRNKRRVYKKRGGKSG